MSAVTRSSVELSVSVSPPLPVRASGSLRRCIRFKITSSAGHVAERPRLDRLVERIGMIRAVGAVRHGDARDDRTIVAEFQGSEAVFNSVGHGLPR